jgi:hypothetical protein
MQLLWQYKSGFNNLFWFMRERFRNFTIHKGFTPVNFYLFRDTHKDSSAELLSFVDGTFSFSALFMAANWMDGACSPSNGGPFSKSADAIASKHLRR